MLDRDRQFRTDHLALLEQPDLWNQAARLAFQDIHATTSLDWSWEVIITISAAESRDAGRVRRRVAMTTIESIDRRTYRAVDEIADIVQRVAEESTERLAALPSSQTSLKPLNA